MRRVQRAASGVRRAVINHRREVAAQNWICGRAAGEFLAQGFVPAGREAMMCVELEVEIFATEFLLSACASPTDAATFFRAAVVVNQRDF